MVDMEYLREAARVASFMEEGEHGRWRLRKFSVTDHDVAMRKLEIEFRERSIQRRERTLQRLVPPGVYISLQRSMTRQEESAYLKQNVGPNEELQSVFKKAHTDVLWEPVMSDTPAEIDEQDMALRHAHGRVLITGLGLGCLVNALLTKPEVEHIDVVEVDGDVIALTSPYYADNPRVTIHHEDAARFDPAGREWDYAWHDIWSHIDSRNLHEETAEHGISYDTIFGWFEDCVDMQGAWAYDMALDMEQIEEAEREKQRAFAHKLVEANFDQRVELLVEETIRDKVVGLPEGPIDPDVRAFFDQDDHPGGGITKYMREQVHRAELDGRFDPERFEAFLDQKDPAIGNPNERLESIDG